MATAASPRPVSSSSRTIAPLPGVSTSAAAPETIFSPTTVQSLTAKQWVIPPRPKPGRKPATDTPPTKRKAQNRAAQRAFRERRAAKVSELEEQIDEIEKEHESVVENLTSQIETLQKNFDQRLNETLGNHENQIRLLQAEINGWRAHCIQLENQVDSEKKIRLAVESELAINKGQAVRLPPRSRIPAKQTNLLLRGKPNPEQYYNTLEDELQSCNICSLDHCQCIDNALGIRSSTEDYTVLVKRSGSPPPSSLKISKRFKHDRSRSPPHLFDDEPEQTSRANLPLHRPAESCGFCQDGSSCPCAELAAEREQIADGSHSQLSSPPRKTTEETLKPNLTGGITSDAHKVPMATCQGKPGTCNQCQKDLKSKLFCQSLATTKTIENSLQPSKMSSSASNIFNVAIPCAAGQACCRVSSALSKVVADKVLSSTCRSSTELDFTTPTPYRDPDLSTGDPNTIHPISHAVTGPLISCADAFTTLSQHPAYDEASKDYGEWLPKLTTIRGNRSKTPVPLPANISGANLPSEVPARTAFDIEAASVMGVLKFFDRRFGKEA